MKMPIPPTTALLLALSALNVTAATRTWDGSVNGNLSTPGNWVGGVAPVNGDDLVFPASGVSRFFVTNNILGGPQFPVITFLGGGYELYGAFIVTRRVGAENVTGFNRVNCALQLSTNGTIFINGDTGALLDINGNVTIGPYNLSVSAGGGTLAIEGVISGTGGVSKISGGTVRFEGVNANTYTGPTTVFGGTLELRKGSGLADALAVPGNLTISDAADIVRFGRHNQIASTATVTIGPGALLDLVASSNVFSTLTLNGGQVTGGTVALNGNVTATGAAGTSAAISSTVELGSSARTFTVNDDTATDPDLTLSGLIRGAGGVTKAGAGTLAYSGSASNIYAGATRVDDGTLLLRRTSFDRSIPGELFIGDGIGGPTNDVVRLESFAQINNLSAVTIASSGLLDLNGISETIGSLAGAGRVEVGPNNLGVGVNGASTTYSGEIIGSGALTKMGLGTLTLTGTNSNTGQTLVADGTLLVDGSQPRSPVDVTNGTLGGDGTVGNVSIAGNLAPGASPGSLDCSNLTFSAQGDFFVELAGDSPGPNGYDQMNVRGTVALNGATLHVSNHSAPFEGQRFVIISNDGADPVTGTFAGLPNGSVLSLSGVQFHLRYGNDVELIATNTALSIFGSPVVSSGNLNARIDPNECNLLHVILSNAASVPVTGIRATLRSQRDGVAVTQPFATYPDLAPGELGTNQEPFQVSLLPGSRCGIGLASELLIETASHGTFRDAAGSPSGGVAGVPVRFDNNGLVAIPDLDSVNSIVNVSGIESLVREVTVSLHITHPAVEDLDIALTSPGGKTVNLSSDNGGAAANYGTGCADDQRTVFDSAPATHPPITTASAPFVGTFRPEEFLATFNFDFGPQVNGLWTLRVSDDTGGDTGILHCWSLFITPYVCLPGGGPCESCPERTTLGAIGDMSLLQTGRLVRNGAASACDVAKACPGVEDAAMQRRFDAYTFVNGETNACISVALGVSANANCDLFSAAYANAFNPPGLCQNYLADLGNSLTSGMTNSYSFNVAAYQRFVVVVSQSDPSSAYCPYRLDVTGGSCRPVLHITDAGADHAMLDWTTAAVGYQLERTNALAAPSGPQWLPVTNPPAILNSRFRLTNTVAPDGTRFYRLRKP